MMLRFFRDRQPEAQAAPRPIQVYLRQCYYSPNTAMPGRARPEWFDKAKVFRNFRETIDPVLASCTVLYDNRFGPRDETFLADEPDCIEFTAGTEAGSFLAMLDIAMASGLPDDTIVYFLEDDYLHRENWCTGLLEGFELGAHYVTLYDHRDKYFPPYQQNPTTILFTKSVHWRATPSTCNSYAMKLATLREDIDIHRRFSVETASGVSRDHDKFIALWDHRRTLISPMPGYSTHCDSHLSPVIDWRAYCR